MDGYPDEVPLGDYESDPGNKFRTAAVDDAIRSLAAAHRTVLLPVYEGVSGFGGGARYRIVGFAAFTVSGWDAHAGGSSSALTGSFREVVRHGAGGRGTPYFGAKIVRLVR